MSLSIHPLQNGGNKDWPYKWDRDEEKNHTHTSILFSSWGRQDGAEERCWAESQETGVLVSALLLFNCNLTSTSTALKWRMGLGPCQLKCPTYLSTGFLPYWVLWAHRAKETLARALWGRWGGASSTTFISISSLIGRAKHQGPESK